MPPKNTTHTQADVVHVKKVNDPLVPCSAVLYHKKKMRQKQMTGACPNWATVKVNGTPYCDHHAPISKGATRIEWQGDANLETVTFVDAPLSSRIINE